MVRSSQFISLVVLGYMNRLDWLCRHLNIYHMSMFMVDMRSRSWVHSWLLISRLSRSRESRPFFIQSIAFWEKRNLLARHKNNVVSFHPFYRSAQCWQHWLRIIVKSVIWEMTLSVIHCGTIVIVTVIEANWRRLGWPRIVVKISNNE